MEELNVGSGKKCSSCGGTVGADAKTCQNCGHSFAAGEVIDLGARVAALEAAILALGVQELGDSDGHPFHGNQYSGGNGPSADLGPPGSPAANRIAKMSDGRLASDKAFGRAIADGSKLSTSRLEELQDTYGVETAPGVNNVKVSDIDWGLESEQGDSADPAAALEDAQRVASDHNISAMPTDETGPSGWPTMAFEGKAKDIFEFLDAYDGGGLGD